MHDASYEEGSPRPAGEVYDWYQRGLELLQRGDAAAAAQLLAHAHASEPESASVLEALARALFDAHRYADAAVAFRDIVAANPDDDYAHFGLGLSLSRLGRPARAAEHLALAATMRPGRAAYVEALRQVRATLRARDDQTEPEPDDDRLGPS
jgi:tetratricopeptide (TPR) repeat protein